MSQNIKGIVAIGDGNVIGTRNTLPWPRIDEDLRYFYMKTRGCSVIMGRKTAESIKKVFPLVERDNIVLSRKSEDEVRALLGKKQYKVCSSWEEALSAVEKKTVWVCGGVEVYEKGLRFIDEFHVSHISKDYFIQKERQKYTRLGFPKGKNWVLHQKKKVSEAVTVEIYRRNNGEYTEFN